VEVDVVNGVVALAGELVERSTPRRPDAPSAGLEGVVDVVSHLTWRVDDGGLARCR
jgi:hypothetical protein